MTRRSGIMLCYPFEEKRLSKWSFPVFVQPKLDGVRCRAVPYQHDWIMLSSEEKEITSCPHILNELYSIPRHLWMELDGELYCHGQTFEQISSVTSRTKNLHHEHSGMEFHVFDAVSEYLTQHDRFILLKELFVEHSTRNLKRVETYQAMNLSEIMELNDSFIKNGYEGIVVRKFNNSYVRKRSTEMMKFKPTKSDWYEIIGWKEEVDKYGNPKGRLGALICVGSDGTEFSVGSGLTDELRTECWADLHSLVGRYAKVKYQHITPGKGVPRFPVLVEIVDVSGELS